MVEQNGSKDVSCLKEIANPGFVFYLPVTNIWYLVKEMEEERENQTYPGRPVHFDAELTLFKPFSS